MELPPALATKLGPLRRCEAVGVRGGTWRLEREDGPALLKRMAPERTPEAVAEVLARLRASDPPRAPALLRAVRLADPADSDPADSDPVQRAPWYGLFSWLDGAPRRAEDTGWATAWPQVLALLATLREVRTPASGLPLLTELWLRRVTAMEHLDAIAGLLRQQLVEHPPLGPLGLAHGDFGLQNLVWHAGEVALVDWEELGLAPAEFDGGWLLAMSTMGATPSLQPTELRPRLVALGLEDERLRWYQGLGLLRLSWRMRALSLPAAQAGAIAQRVRAAMVELLR
jgi:aminoglycoside phosphotransferase (APT) family kinase protein